MGRLVGIDLGTTNSVVAVMRGPDPEVVENRDAMALTRSVVSLKRKRGRSEGHEEILVGAAAIDNAATAPADTIISVKRLMGRGFGDPEVQRIQQWADYEIVQPRDGTKDSVRVVMGGSEYSPVDISAEILRKLVSDTEFRLGEPVTHAVITVPAYFSQIQRAATRNAGLQAGIKVIRLIDEPTAAALAFGVRLEDSTAAKTIVVYDLGGGTFDVAVLIMAGGVFAPLNVEGDMWLGGDDFDRVIVDRALAYIDEEFGIDPTGNRRFMAALRQAAQRVKERLGASRAADLVVPPGLLQDDDGNFVDVDIEITREWFEEGIRPLVARTVALTRTAVEHADLSVEDIDHVVMAGNTTAIPMVQRAMEDVFGPTRVLRSVHPKHCVAMGAALLAALIGPRVVCEAADGVDPKQLCGHVNPSDATECQKCGAPLGIGGGEVEHEIGLQAPTGIAPFPYGTQSAGDAFHIFVEKGENYPTTAPKTELFKTRLPGQRLISIPVYGGDDREHASANQKQGEVLAVLPRALPADTGVRVKLWLDHDGIFQVTAELEDGTNLNPRPLHEKGEALAQAVERLEDADKVVAARAVAMSPARRGEIDRLRDGVLDEISRGDLAAARERVKALGELVDRPEGPPEAGPADPRADLARLIGYTDHVLNGYDWAFPPRQLRMLEELLAAARAVRAEGDPEQMRSKTVELDRATDDLPELVQALMGIKGAIRARIAGHDPARARQLAMELEEIEKGLRSGSSSSVAQLEELMLALEAEIDRLDPQLRCSLGHDVPDGERYCPVCREDTRLLKRADAGQGVRRGRGTP
jgi:molecular chaperone DnaK